MSTLAVNTITNAAGANTAVINGMTPTAQSLQGFRNRIINGDMRIDQRRNGASVTASSGVLYTLDRWSTLFSQSSKYTVQRNAGGITPPNGFSNYLGVTSLSAYTVNSTDYNFLIQIIEGFNASDLGWGTANAQTVTLSFWVRSSLTGTFSGSVRNGAGSVRSYAFPYTINSANTWEFKTITIAGDTSGVWPSENTPWGSVTFCLGSGSTRLGAAGSWQGADLDGVTGTTSVVGTNGATFYVTGVQFEAGAVATPFERRDYARELMMCQRYYQQLGNSSYVTLGAGLQHSTTTSVVSVPFLCPMRATPTSTFANLIATDRISADASVSNVVITASTTGAYVVLTNAAFGATFRPVLLAVANLTNGYLAFSSEL